MVLHPRFHRPVAEDRCAKKTALGFDPALPVGLVSFGAYGAQEMRVIAERLADRQALFICGHNQRLARAIAAVPATAPRRILGFTTELPELMDACDYFIGKPGPGSIGEALARGLPVIVSRNARTMPQERYNADWVLEQGVGQVVRHFREVDQTVTQLLAKLPIYRRRLRRLDNHAVFQLPGILDTVLQASSLRSTAPLHPTEPALA
jgi:UDP-N-acetylglucosamine:LPS N-acetylglucosamine transferase